MIKKRMLQKTLSMLLTIAMTINIGAISVFAQGTTPPTAAFHNNHDAAKALLAQMYQRSNTAVMTKEEPLETITVDDSNIIHRPTDYLPMPKLERSGDIAPFALVDENQSGPFVESDERYFRIEVSGGGQNQDYRTVLGRLVATGASTNVWVVDDADFHAKIGIAHDDDTCKVPAVTYPMAKDLATGFDGIYGRMTADFAPFGLYETNIAYLPKLGDLGDDSDVNILLYDIDALEGGGNNYVAGYFWAYDMIAANQDFNDSELVHPIDMFHVDIGAGQGWEGFSGNEEAKLDIYGTLAHEFQHMLFFTHFGIYSNFGDSDYTWFNESLSGLADMYYVQPGAEIISLSRTAYAATNPYDGSGYGDLFVFNGSMKNYGMGYLLSALFQNYTNGAYAEGIYDFLTTGAMENDGTVDQFVKKYEVINDTTVFTSPFVHIGAMLNGGLGLGGEDIENGYPIAFDVAYQFFIENFLADGGLVGLAPSRKLLQGTAIEQNLWGLRPLLGNPNESLETLPAIPVLRSGDMVVTADSSFTAATQDILYKLEGGDDMINIRIPELRDNKSANFYLALKNPEDTTGVTGADIQLLAEGDNQIITTNREVYLFVSTLLNSLTEADAMAVTYTWDDIGAEYENGTASIDNTTPRIGDTLTASFKNEELAFTPYYMWYVVIGENAYLLSNTEQYTVAADCLGLPIALGATVEQTSDLSGIFTQAVTAPVKKQLYVGSAPAAPTATAVNHNSVTLNTVTNSQYSNGGATWQDSSLFSGLSPGTAYTFYTRIKETPTMEASEQSQGTQVTTAAKSAGSLTIATQPMGGTYTFGTEISPLSIVVENDDNTKLTYRWYKNTIDSTSGGILVSSTDTASYVPTEEPVGTVYYYCVVSKTVEGQTVTATSNTAKLIITKANQTSSGGGGGSTVNSENAPSIIPPEPDQENPSTTVKTKVDSRTDKNGNATATVPDKSVSDAIKKAQEEAKRNDTVKNGITIVVDVTIDKNASALDASFSQKAIVDMIAAGVTALTIKNGLATVTLDREALQHLGSGGVTFSIKQVNARTLSLETQNKVGGRPVYDLSITGKNGTKITDFRDGTVTVSIPYTLADGENPNHITGYYIDASGKAQDMDNAAYDLVTKALCFTTNHFSIYAVGYKTFTFSDTSNHWAKIDIDFIAARGILNGTSTTTFSPDQSMTRGMFVTALGRLAGININKFANTKFNDVKADVYYSPYVAWAAENNIVNGTTDTMFSPDNAITRQEMTVMLVNYSKAVGYKLPSTHAEITFADNGSVAIWAAQSVKQMQMAGILSGKSDNKFDPTATATRAEVSAMLHRYVVLPIR